MIRIEEGVRLAGIRSELVLGLLIADQVFGRYEQECVITSAMRDRGPEDALSLHHVGLAADLRTRDLPGGDVAGAIRIDLSAALSRDWDVVLEEDHIHMEFDPKRG